MYIEKLKVMNMILDREKYNDKIFELIDVETQTNLLSDLKIIFSRLMFYLWEKPKIMALILKNAEIKDIKDYLANLVVNNFYENILSSTFIEENLIYVLTLLLNEEINNLLNIEQHSKFLEETCCGYLLEELRKKKDIQTFFKNIITEPIENLETNFSNLKLNFDINIIYSNYLEDIKNKIKSEKIYLNNFKEEEIEKMNEENMLLFDERCFNGKYISFLHKKSFDKFVKKNNLDSNKSLHDIYISKIDNLSANDQLLYSNQQLLININKHDIPNKLMHLYQRNFFCVINFINLILEKILNNFNLIPYSIKCFCKIISLMLIQKFPEMKESEKIIFLSKFFFKRLLIPILKNPETEAFINTIIISENTLNNLNIICDVINKFISGELYTCDNSEFTPFNWYFIEQSQKIYKIFEHASNVTLPSFIEDYINHKLPSEFEYDYFEQNKDELINFRSICFNIHEALALMKAIDKCSNEIYQYPNTDIIKKIMTRLKSQNSKTIINEIILKENIINENQKKEALEKEKEIIESDDIEILADDIISLDSNKNNQKQKIFYFLFTSLLTNDSFKKLFEISQPTKSFTTKEIKNSTNNEENSVKNNIIKVKNFFCSLLFNFDKLVKSNFNPDKIGNTEKILEELNILMKSSYFVIDGTIPFDWYINSIYEYLKKIPENLTKNDCEELYKEIEQDVNNSLAQLDFIKLSVILEKLEFAERGKIFYKENQKFLNEIKIKAEVRKIIYNEFIPVSIKFSWNDNKKGILQIERTNFKIKDKDNKEKINSYQNSKKLILALTIDDFTEKFPNLRIYQKYQDDNIFKIQEKLNFAENLEKYFDIVFNYIESPKQPKQKNNKKEFNINNKEQIRENIFDYVMNKIYDKLFPVDVNQNDSKLYNNSVKLSWVKPCHFLGEKKQYVFGGFINDTNKYFKQLISEKSTRKKLITLDKIFDNISFFYNFNSVREIGVDDIISLLSYAMIKVDPFFLDSNIQYMKIYSKLGKFFSEENKFEQFQAAMNLIINIKYTNLKGITEKEFLDNMNNSENDIK